VALCSKATYWSAGVRTPAAAPATLASALIEASTWAVELCCCGGRKDMRDVKVGLTT
jgi:hypothetical protein